MSLKRKINWNKTYHVLFENDFKNYKHLIQVIFLGKAHFEENVDQNYLVFQPIIRNFKRNVGVYSGEYISF